MSLHYKPPTGDTLIEQEYVVRKPNGEKVRVNRFDFNLAHCGDPSTYIQCSDLGWIRVRQLEIVA